MPDVSADKHEIDIVGIDQFRNNIERIRNDNNISLVSVSDQLDDFKRRGAGVKIDGVGVVDQIVSQPRNRLFFTDILPFLFALAAFAAGRRKGSQRRRVSAAGSPALSGL